MESVPSRVPFFLISLALNLSPPSSDLRNSAIRCSTSRAKLSEFAIVAIVRSSAYLPYLAPFSYRGTRQTHLIHVAQYSLVWVTGPPPACGMPFFLIVCVISTVTRQDRIS